ncbi:MAG: hypothetical protein QOH06_2124 [Acidobacteriota bacterium]|jgi:hypothetical protein|nr:hypothetical protein [Acidobacteriota bacterium]
MLSAFVAVSEAKLAALKAAEQPIPAPVPVRALVDTGASCTCIDPSVLSALNLTPTGNVSLNTASSGQTPHSADQYDVGFVIPNGNTPLFLRTIPVVATELLAAQGFHALLGRDILAHCILVYNGDMGFFTLAF